MQDENRRALERLLAVLTLLLVFFMAARYAATPDTWWHLRAGEWIWQHKALPQVDHFSFTRMGYPWHYPGWPVEVVFYLLFALGGVGMLNLFLASMVTLVFGVVWLTAEGHPLLKAALLALAATASAVHWSARPYLVTLLFSAIYLWLLSRWKKGQGNRAIWWLPLLMLVWVNSHGGFTLGFVWWGVYFSGVLVRWFGFAFQKRKEESLHCRRNALALGAVGVAMGVAALLNPYGPEMLFYTSKTLHMDATKLLIGEWQSPNFHQVQLWPLLAMLLLLLLGVGLSSRRWSWEEAVLTLGVTYMVLTWVRNADVFAVVVTPILSAHWEDVRLAVARHWPKRQKAAPPPPVHRKINLAIIALAGLIALGKGGVMTLPKVNAALTAKNYPVEALDFLHTARPPGQLFNEYNWGGFLIWNLREYPVFIDGRADLYGDAFIKKWLATRDAEKGWEATLDYWGVRTVLLQPDAPLAKVLPTHGWRLLYHDDRSVIYGR